MKRIRHLKKGTTYEALGEALFQVSRGDVALERTDAPRAKPARVVVDGDPVVMYRADDGMMFARFPDEMTDGRFADVEDAGPDGPAPS